MGDRLRGRPRRTARLAAASIALAALGCASTPDYGVTHVLRPGENLYRLSRYYGVPIRSIERANHIGDVTELPVGAKIFVPGTRRAPPTGSLAVAYTPAEAPVDARLRALDEADLAFTWPVSGKLNSRFGWRRGKRHEGIDIGAPRGTPIRAAEAGRVIHSGGGLGAYGTVVIIKHAGDYQSVYAHNRRNHVRKGDFVEKGQLIAEVGKTGNASGPHLHFEIRRQRRPVDPLGVLP